MRCPAEALESIPEDDSVSREPFTISEIARLLKAAPSREWEGVILLGAFAGLRLGDAANLKAGNVSTAERILRFQPRKTSRHGRVLTVPLHPELTAFFDSYKLPEDPEQPCFPFLETGADGRTAGLSNQFSKIIQTAGLSRNIGRRGKAGGSGRSTYALSFHSLRHSFVSLMANQDVIAEMRMKLAGHRKSEVHQIYTSTELATLRRAVESIPVLSETKEKSRFQP